MKTLNEAIDEARAATVHYPEMVAVVFKAQMSANSRKYWFGFSFRPEGHEDAVVGRVITNDDSSVHTVFALA
jgi:L-amino acid N-acyltransferase YncA